MPMSATDAHVIEILTQILKVEAIQAASSKSVTEGARLLKLAGLDNQTIAEVLNTSPATVRTLTANLRSGRGGRRHPQRRR
jgi:DNA-binding NarL/FixJ family response regulator